MRSTKMLVLTGAMTLLALPLGACSSSVKLSSARMCTAAGGTYTASACNAGQPNQRTGAQICQAHGGIYDPVLDSCEIPGSSK